MQESIIPHMENSGFETLLNNLLKTLKNLENQYRMLFEIIKLEDFETEDAPEILKKYNCTFPIKSKHDICPNILTICLNFLLRNLLAELLLVTQKFFEDGRIKPTTNHLSDLQIIVNCPSNLLTFRGLN